MHVSFVRHCLFLTAFGSSVSLARCCI